MPRINLMLPKIVESFTNLSGCHGNPVAVATKHVNDIFRIVP